jgi:hypothetical protein
MEIITKLPRSSNGDADRALLNELRYGVKLKEAWENEREKICAQHADKIKTAQKDAFKSLRCVAVTPAWEWFNMRNKYGAEAMRDRGFMKDFQKRFPHLSPNKI